MPRLVYALRLHELSFVKSSPQKIIGRRNKCWPPESYIRMARNEIPRKRMRWVSGLLLILAGCIDSPVTAPTAAAPILSGQARVWFYRPWEPSESLDLALIDMNGSYVGAVANGSAFYRDVPPGHYHIAPESFGRDFNQDRSVDLSPGQQLYVKIVSLNSWGMSVSGCKNCARDAFYAWLIPPEIAQAEIARDRTGI